jgi:hypothetical protein
MKYSLRNFPENSTKKFLFLSKQENYEGFPSKLSSKFKIPDQAQMSHNVPAVGDVFAARISKP